jgi:hypothetical protein
MRRVPDQRDVAASWNTPPDVNGPGPGRPRDRRGRSRSYRGRERLLDRRRRETQARLCPATAERDKRQGPPDSLWRWTASAALAPLTATTALPRHHPGVKTGAGRRVACSLYSPLSVQRRGRYCANDAPRGRLLSRGGLGLPRPAPSRPGPATLTRQRPQVPALGVAARAAGRRPALALMDLSRRRPDSVAAVAHADPAMVAAGAPAAPRGDEHGDGSISGHGDPPR